MQGYDKDDLSGMVEKITSGSTKALETLKWIGYSSDNLTSMLEKVTEGCNWGSLVKYQWMGWMRVGSRPCWENWGRSDQQSW